MSGVMRCMLRCMLEAVEGRLCLLEMLEVLEVLEAMRCVLFCMLEAVEGELSFSGFRNFRCDSFLVATHRPWILAVFKCVLHSSRLQIKLSLFDSSPVMS